MNLPMILNILVFTVVVIVYIGFGVLMYENEMDRQEYFQLVDKRDAIEKELAEAKQKLNDTLDRLLKDLDPKLGPPLEYYSI